MFKNTVFYFINNVSNFLKKRPLNSLFQPRKLAVRRKPSLLCPVSYDF